MAGPISSAKRAAQKNLASDPDYYKKIGAVGGKNGNKGGFASRLLCDCVYAEDLHKKAMCAGAKGGRISRRVGKKVHEAA